MMQDQQAAPAPGAEQQPSGMPPSDDEQGPLTQMIVQTDRALSSIAQVLAKASPEAAQAMGQLSEQYRQIITAVLSQGQEGAAPQQQGARPASPMVSPETHGKPAMQAY